ncbi:MAG: dTDP-glucose 4,6-dehydratase [bacterium]
MKDVFQPRVVVVTGGAGFIGSNLVRWILANVRDVAVVNVDALTYAGTRTSLADVETQHGRDGSGRYFFSHLDVRDTAGLTELLAGNARDTLDGRAIPSPDAVLHLAAETHVDRSIASAAAFVSTNVQGTMSLLDAVKSELDARPREFRMINVSTDEVYGSLGEREPPFTEHHGLRPNSPYSASKAGADCLVRAYVETHGLPCIITRSSNNYGPYQFPEKLIPYLIARALRDESLPIYGDGGNVRDWLHVEDHVEGLWRVCTHGRVADEVYNIGGGAERRNLDVARTILAVLGKPESRIELVADRPGHDRRYALDCTRIRDTLGWTPSHAFDDGLRNTVAWYLANRQWWEQSFARASHHSPA